LDLNFKEFDLSSLIKLKYGKNQKKVEDKNGKFPIFGTGGLMGYATDFLYDKPSVLIPRKGSISNVYYQQTPFWTVDTLFYTEINENLIIPKYLYYYISRIDLNKYNEGTTIPSLRSDTLNHLKINVPPILYQKQVLKLLSNIDNILKNNNQLNQNLEDQITTIFKNWFVNFNFLNNLNELYSNSGVFKDSELGKIPVDWSIDFLGSKKVSSIINSGIKDFEGSKIYLATADVENSSIVDNNNLITIDKKPSRANMQPIPKSIWFAKMKDSRKLIKVDEYSKDLINNYIFSTGFCGLSCNDNAFYYLWSFILSKAFDEMKNVYCNGTTMQAINNTNVKNIKFILPDEKTLLKFNQIVFPLFKQIDINNKEIEKLTAIRDILLPKLMSGEIDVSQIEVE
jgi:type I restriction enzyme S subunit